MASRVVVNSSAVLSVTFYGDETAIDADGQLVTVTVTGASGTVYATDAATTRVSTGVYRWTSAALPIVDYLTLVWTGTFSGVEQSSTTHAEVVGGYYASLAEIRAADPSLANTSTWTAAKLADARARAEDHAEAIMGRSWVERMVTERTTARCGRVGTRWAPVRTVYAVTVDGTAYEAAELAALNLASNRYIVGGRINGWWADSSVVDITYTTGEYGPPPSDVVDAIVQLTRIKAMAPQSRIPDRADRFVSDAGRTFMLSSPSADRTGHPDIDAVLQRYRIPAIG